MLLGDSTARCLNGQTQYVSYYLDGVGGRPALGQDLDYKDHSGNYHAITIDPVDACRLALRIAAIRTDAPPIPCATCPYKSLLQNENSDMVGL